MSEKELQEQIMSDFHKDANDFMSLLFDELHKKSWQEYDEAEVITDKDEIDKLLKNNSGKKCLAGSINFSPKHVFHSSGYPWEDSYEG